MAETEKLSVVKIQQKDAGGNIIAEADAEFVVTAANVLTGTGTQETLANYLKGLKYAQELSEGGHIITSAQINTLFSTEK